MHIMAREEIHYHETIIRELRPYLKGRFNPIDVLDDISIGQSDREKIIQDCKNDGDSRASSNLLDILRRYPVGTFIKFTIALCTHGRKDLAQKIYQHVPDRYKSKFSVVLQAVQDPSSMNRFSDASHLEAGAVGGVTPHRSVSFPEIAHPDQHDRRDHGLQHDRRDHGLQHDRRDHGLQHSQSAPQTYPRAERDTIDRLLSEVSIEDNRAYPEPPEMPLFEMIQEQSEEMIKVLQDNVDYPTVVKKLQRRHYIKVKDFNCFTLLLEELEGRGWTVKKFVDEIVMKLHQQFRNQILVILKYPIPSDDKKVVNLDLPNTPSMPPETRSTISPAAQPPSYAQLYQTDQDDDRNAVNRNLPYISLVPQESASTQSATAHPLSDAQQCQNDQGGFNAHKGPGIDAELMHRDASAELMHRDASAELMHRDASAGRVTTVPLPIQSEADPHSEHSSKPPGLEAERLCEDRMAASSELQITLTESEPENLQSQLPQQFMNLSLQTHSNNGSFVTMGGNQNNQNVPSVIDANNRISGSPKVTHSVAQSDTARSDDVERPNPFGVSHNNNSNITEEPTPALCGCSTTSSTGRSTGEDAVTTEDSMMDSTSASHSLTDALNPNSDLSRSSNTFPQPFNDAPKPYLYQNPIGLLDTSYSSSGVSEQLQSSETPFDSEAVNLDSYSQNEETIPKILYEEKTDQNNARSDVSHGIDQLDDDHPGEDQSYVSPDGDQSDDRPDEDQSDDRPGEDQSDERPGEDQSDDRPGEDQSDVSPDGDQSEDRPGEDQSDDRPGEYQDIKADINQAGVSQAIAVSDINRTDERPDEDQSDDNPDENQGDIKCSIDQSVDFSID